MVDLALLGYSAVAALCVAIAIVLITNRVAWWPVVWRIVSSVSGRWHESLERARAQKTVRERLYGYVDLSQRQRQGDYQQRKFAQSVNRFSPSRPEDAWYAGDNHMSSAAESPVSADLIPVSGTGIGRNTAADLVSLTEGQIVEALARRKDARGKYIYSGKKIYALVGGNYNEFVAKVQRIRGEDADLDGPQHVTPIVGRATNAKFETDPDYPYQAPAT